MYSVKVHFGLTIQTAPGQSLFLLVILENMQSHCALLDIISRGRGQWPKLDGK